MEELKELDDLFKKGLENARITPPSGVWEGIASSVSTATTVAGQTSVWLVAAKWFAGVLVAAGVTYTAISILPDSKKNAKSDNAAAVVNGTQNKQNPAALDPNAAESAASEARHGSDHTPTISEGSTAIQDMEQAPMGQEYVLEIPEPDAKLTAPWEDGNKPFQTKPNNTANRAGSTGTAGAGGECRHSVAITYQRVSGNAFSFNAANAAGVATWYFGDGTLENGFETSHEFGAAPGVYTVKVVTVGPTGCRDSATEKIVISGARPLLMNIFTPNGDGLNDEYFVDVKNTAVYDLVIRDMQDRQVFHSDNPNSKWDGKCGTIICPEGKYQVTFVYKYPGDAAPVVIREVLILTRDKMDGN